MIYLLDTNILIYLIKNHPPQVAERIEVLTRLVPVLYPQGPGICEHYAVQATALKRRATPIGANGLWIACHTLAIGAVVVSHNVSEFSRVDGLQLADWAA